MQNKSLKYGRVPVGHMQQVLSLLEASEYYADMSVQDIVGAQFYGAYEDATLVACVMVIKGGPQAYLDYLCVHVLYQQSGVATALLSHVSLVLRMEKVRRLHASIRGTNALACKLASKFSVDVGWPYVNVAVNLMKE